MNSRVLYFASAFLVFLIVSSAYSPLHEANDRVNSKPNMDTNATVFHYMNATYNPFLMKRGIVDSINPYLYAAEPAPMGIADYGIGQNGIPYETNRPSYTGTVNISSISTLNSSWPQHSMGFQLNLNLVFINSGIEYVFWVQDVALLNTTSHQIQFLDNIWNSSSPQAEMLNSSVSGNGTMGESGGTGFYYCVPGAEPGNLISLSYPVTVTMRMNASVNINGYPEVNFSYNDGYGWVTYDRAVFSFADSVINPPEFQVSGFAYKPDNLPMDAEFIMGGPGGGSDTEDITSNVSMALNYWNGHNYQAVSNAYNFGSNTAEGISNVSITPLKSSESGIPGVLAKSGSGTLQMAYNTSTVGFLNLSSSNLPSGVLYIGTTPVPYENGGANLTLRSGTYYVHLASGARKFNFGNVSVRPGAVTRITTILSYWVNFTEFGLPSGTSWGVNVSGTQEYSTGDTISLLLHNGSYLYNVMTIPGYSATNNSGELNISGMSISIYLEFSLVKYVIHVIQNGLPSGVQWYLNISQTLLYSSDGSIISFFLPNGTYLYNFSTPNSIFSGGSGSFRVYGANVSFTVDFVQNGHIIVVSRINYTLSLNGQRILHNKQNYSVYLTPGTYYLVAYAPGYYAYSTIFLIRYGEVMTLNISLEPIPVYGFLNGTVDSNNATITANGIPVSILNEQFNETLPAGRYVISLYGNNLTPMLYSVIIYGGVVTYLNMAPQPTKTFGINGYIFPGNAEVVFNGLPAATNSSGFYKIEIPEGEYDVSVTAAGYMPASFNLSVDRNLSHDFNLIRIHGDYTSISRGIVTIESENISLLTVNYTSDSVSVDCTSLTDSGTLLILVSLGNLSGSSVLQALKSRVYVNGNALSNYTITITANYTVILSVNIHKADPIITWLLNSTLPAPTRNLSSRSNPAFLGNAGDFLTLGALIIILGAAFVLVRKKRS